MIAGITKVRNESFIVKDTLEHFSEFCDHLFIYDDASTDDTVEICESFPNVTVHRGTVWDPNRFAAERDNRQVALQMAQDAGAEWIVCFDADERFVLPENWQGYDGVRMQLFDFYITPEDVHLPYTERKWLGPEFRSILMMYRNLPGIKFDIPDQREMRLPSSARILNAGYVKHYGKSISVEQWEDTCTYYETHFPEPYKTKWANRHGKAIHTDMSDFGAKLIQWEDRDRLGFRL